MILHRIAEAFRSRDWFTFAIEFGLVVAGVFIGIQVANWNEARNEAAPEDLARLIDSIGAGQAPEPSVGWRGVEAALDRELAGTR